MIATANTQQPHREAVTFQTIYMMERVIHISINICIL